jgi:hypothetical protein
MKLNRVLLAVAAVVMVGGSAVAVGTYGGNLDATQDEVAALDQNGNELAAPSSDTNNDLGTEQYRGGGRGGGGRGGAVHGGGGRGFSRGGGHWGGGHGWGGRGWGGRGWGRGWGYRGGRWGYYGYDCARDIYGYCY